MNVKQDKTTADFNVAKTPFSYKVRVAALAGLGLFCGALITGLSYLVGDTYFLTAGLYSGLTAFAMSCAGSICDGKRGNRIGITFGVNAVCAAVVWSCLEKQYPLSPISQAITFFGPFAYTNFVVPALSKKWPGQGPSKNFLSKPVQLYPS